MKTLILIPILFGLFVMFTIHAQTNVRRYESERGLFSVLLPGSNSQETPLKDGFASNGQVRSIDQDIIYDIAYTYSCEDTAKRVVVDRMIDNIKKALKAKKDFAMVSEQKIETEYAYKDANKMFSGYETVIESKSERLKYSFHFVNSVIYQLIVSLPPSSAEPTAVRQFFSSFEPVANETYLPSYKSRKLQEQGASESEEVIKGNAIRLVTPLYPEDARRARIQGRVEIRILIDERGTVTSAEPICGDHRLVPASKTAAFGSAFRPTLLSGVPVKVTGILTYNYAF